MSPRINVEVVPIEQVPQENPAVETPVHAPVIMVVDDERIVADTLSAILSHEGYTIITAYDATSALSKASRVTPELVISDVAMPGMNGIELAVKLQQQYPNCKVLLFSGHATSVDLLRNLGANHNIDLLSKPVHPTILLRHIHETLGTVPAHAPRRPASVVSIRRSA